MKASEIIYYIQNVRLKGIQSDDNQISDKQVYFDLNTKRELLIRQEEDKYNVIPQEIVQYLNIELEQASLVDIQTCDINFTNGCLLKSKYPLPRTVSLKSGNDYLYVGTVDGLQPYSEIQLGLFRYLKSSKYSGNKPKYFIKENYLYVTNSTNSALRWLMLKAVFQDPLEVIKFSALSESNTIYNPFDEFNFEYPVTGSMLENIYNLMINRELKLQSTLRDENLNDNKNEQ